MKTLLTIFLMPNPAWKWIHRLGGPGLVLLGLFDNTPFVSAPPGSSDVCVILLAAHNPIWWAYYAFMATVGEVLGGYFTYRLAEKSGQQTLEKRVGKQKAQSIYRGFERFGYMTVLGGALLPPPFPFTTVLMTAGVMQYPRKRFLFALIAGRGLRFFVEAFMGRIYGRQMISFFRGHYHLFMVILVGLAIAGGVGTAIYYLWYRRRRHVT